MCEVNGKVADKSTSENPTTKVVKLFTDANWNQDGEYISITYTFKDIQR
jgi:hypothetical protein